MVDSHDSTFVINDVVLDIPPTHISINKVNSLNKMKAIRTPSSIKFRSGKANLTVTLDLFFVDGDSINNKLRFLVAQFSLTPFCYVENRHLRDSILGADDKGQTMSLALQNMSIRTVPGQPGLLNAQLSFVWFNYKPYTQKMNYKRFPFIPLPQKSPGHAFQLFYLPQLKKHEPVKLIESKLSLQQMEFIIVGNEDRGLEIDQSLAVDEANYDRFRNLFDEFVLNIRDLRAAQEGTDSGETADEVLNDLEDLSFSMGGGDPTVSTHGGVQKVVNEAARVATLLESNNISTNSSSAALQKLLAVNKQLLTVSGQIFSGGDGWLKFPESLLGGSNRVGPDKNASIYYRTTELDMGTEESGFIVEQIEASHSSLLVPLPMVGHQYPTLQYLGSSDKSFSLKIKVLNDAAVAQYTTFLNIHNNNLQNGRNIPQLYTNIQVNNELFSFMGVKEVLLENSIENTVPEQPGLYDRELVLVEKGISPEDVEGLQVAPTSFGAVRRAVWEAIWRKLSIGLKPNLNPTGDLGTGELEFLNNLVNKELRELIFRMLRQLTTFDSSSAFGLGEELATAGDTVSGISHGFKTVLAIFAIQSEDILGVEGLAEVLFLWGQQGSFPASDILERDKLFPKWLAGFAEDGRVITKEDQGTAIFLAGPKKAARRGEKIRKDNIIAKEQRYKNIQAAVHGIESFLDAKKTSTANFSSFSAESATGRLLSLPLILEEAGLEKDLEMQLLKRNKAIKALQEQASFEVGGSRGRSAEIIASISTDDALINRYVQGLREELHELESGIANGNRPGNLAEGFVKLGGSFREWPIFAKNVAESVVNTELLELDMFAGVKKLVRSMRASTKGNVFHDIPMDEVQKSVQHSLGTAYPSGFRLEPDFYFVNETADLNINSFVSEEDLTQIVDYSNQYIDDVIVNNKNWFKETYLKEIGSNFGQFLLDSSSKQTVESVYNDVQNVPGMTLMKTAPDVDKSVNNQAVKTRGQPSANYVNKNNPPPVSQNNLSGLTNSRVSTIHIANTVFASDSTSSSEWIMPMEGTVRVSSNVGSRKKNGRKFHAGTDMVVGGRGSESTFGKPVFAAADGTVVRKKVWDGVLNKGAGNNVQIRTRRSDGLYFHTYMHLHVFTDNYIHGSQVKKGEILGYAGGTGGHDAHLHFEVRRGGSFGTVVYPFDSSLDSLNIPSDRQNSTIAVPLIQLKDSSVTVGAMPAIPPIERGNTILKSSLNSMSKSWNNNAGYRMNRAYPGIYFAIIEESVPGHILTYDAFFNYQSIISCEVAKDREVAADFCKLVLTNVSGILSNRKFQGTVIENELISKNKKAFKTVNKNYEGTAKEKQIDSLMLREGIKVEVRMGYSDVPDKLSTVIVGKIMALQFSDSGDIVELEIQSLASELVQDLKGMDNSVEYTSYLSDDANTGPLLESLISSPECVSFGMWERGDIDGNAINRDLLRNGFQWNPKPAVDNIFAPDKAEMNKIDPGWISDKITYRMYQSTIWDVFKEMELRHPEYIASPVPYVETNGSRKRMTMFFGLPDQLYFSRDPSLLENQRGEDIKAKKDEQVKKLTEAYKTGGNALDAAKQMLSASSVSSDTQAELIGRIKNATKNRAFAGQTLEAQANAGINDSAEKTVDAYIESELAKEALEGGAIQPFRKYHLVTSEMHIIANNIQAKSSNTFNAVTVEYEEYGLFDGIGDTVSAAGLIGPAWEAVSSIWGEPKGPPQIDDVERLTMKLDPTIPDEEVRENFFTFPNCRGTPMAKNYCVSLLQKGAWQIYDGNLVILGNPDIKPYDIVYMHDSYTDMTGPFQVRRAMHYFSHDTGFITVLTPDCLAYPSEGTGLTQNQAMALMAETFLRKSVGLEKNIITPGRSPHDGTQTTPGLYHLAVGAGKLINFFGGKRLIFRTQFDDPIHIVPLFKQGRPMVAGFGPLHTRKNFFATKGFVREAKEALAGWSESLDGMSAAWDDGLISPTGSFFSENAFGVRLDEKNPLLRGNK